MASIQTAIQLQDRVSAPMRNITNALNMTIASFEEMRGESSNCMGSANFNAIRSEINQANTAMNQLADTTNRAGVEQTEYDSRVRRSAQSTSGLLNNVKGMVAAYLSIHTAVSAVKNMVSGANAQTEAETKLQTVMKQRMSATDAQVQSVKNLASEQQKVGVIGDEVQMAGQQQLATFLNSTSALKTLTPAMNNLATQQNGVNATSENMVSIGNMMGKVMQGSTSALTRVGITFSKAQEKALKYGNEQERAATLAQVITDNVGNMNQVLAKTPQGAIQQVKNNLGDMMEVAGYKLMPALLSISKTISDNAPMISNVITGFGTALAVIINVLGHVLTGVSAVASFIGDNWSIIAPIIGAVAGAIMALKISMAIATTAQWFMNAAMYACPLTWMIIIILAIIGAIYAIVAVINKVQHKTISATGVICGAINVVNEAIHNTFMFIANIGVAIFNVLSALANNVVSVFYNAFKDVQIFFYDMIGGILDGILAVGNAMNKLPFIDFDMDGLNNAASDYASKADEANKDKKSYQSIGDAWSNGMNTFDAFGKGWAKDAYDNGYKMGTDVDKTVGKIASKFNPKNIMKNAQDAVVGPSASKIADDAAAKTAGNTGKTAANTAAMKDSLDITSSNLKYIRDFATQRAVNRYSSSTIKIDMTNHNNIGKDQDVDGIVTKLKEKLTEEMASSAEGAMT